MVTTLDSWTAIDVRFPLPTSRFPLPALDRPTRATRAHLATSAEEFAKVARPAIAAAVAGGAPASLLAVRVDVNGAPAAPTLENGQSAALREQVIELIRRNLRG